MTQFASFVLFSADVAAAAAFYRALGVPLEQEQHDGGPLHCAAELGEVHVALYPADAPGRAPARRSAGSSLPGVYVSSLDHALAAVRAAGDPCG